MGEDRRDSVNRQSHLRWEQEGVPLPAREDSVIEAGDLVWWDDVAHAVRPASEYTWDTDLATTQTTFAEVFVGVAAYASPDGETEEILVLTDGEFKFRLRTASDHVGPLDFWGPAQGAGPALLNQAIDRAVRASSIGAFQNYRAAVGAWTFVEVRISSMLRSTNINAETG